MLQGFAEHIQWPGHHLFGVDLPEPGQVIGDSDQVGDGCDAALMKKLATAQLRALRSTRSSWFTEDGGMPAQTAMYLAATSMSRLTSSLLSILYGSA
ncbi:hypothetical protein BME99_06615 [Pseudomonas protegens]|nr:hypothetical protein BME99_06615 [Pseudomonas protegens]